MTEPSFRTYVDDERHMEAYSAYQARYADTLRESDRVLIELVREVAPAGGSLLDIGCSTGNLLLHLKHAGLGLNLHGADIVESVIEDCRVNQDLEGVEFHVLDMLSMEPSEKYDVVTANAALMFFTDEEFAKAIQGLAGALKPGGHLVAFDYFHPADQQVSLVETSRAFPEGLRYFFRGEPLVRGALTDAGLDEPRFLPFEIPIDLPRPGDPADISTWTRRDSDGRGMSFRGTVFQPWCHLVARRPG